MSPKPKLYLETSIVSYLTARIEAICRATGFEPPIICTPVELVKEL